MGEKDRRELEQALREYLDKELLQLLFSDPKDRKKHQKAKVRPLLVKGQLIFQVEEFIGKQVFHKNLSAAAAAEELAVLLQDDFGRCEIWSEKGWGQVLVSKKGKVTIKRKRKIQAGRTAGTAEMTGMAGEYAAGIGQTGTGMGKTGQTMPEGMKKTEVTMPAEGMVLGSAEDARSSAIRLARDMQLAERLSHDRRKAYILQEGHPVPFLQDLGVMTETGKVVRAKYDKFRQINRFLEFIQDILPQLSKDQENVIIDFGCGKSYLTFALYHYLTAVKSYPVRVIGLDLKQEVIDHCNRLSQKYGFDHLQFYHGDIASYEGVDHVDMVVTLHACDTATDYALAKAVAWRAKVILSVPCCQHEWNRQMKNELMEPILHYGLLKERIAALYTDGLRAELLEHAGYRTQVLEFIDMEHTPKNILIRAVRQEKPKDNGEEIRKILEFWEVEPTLARLLLDDRPVLGNV